MDRVEEVVEEPQSIEPRTRRSVSRTLPPGSSPPSHTLDPTPEHISIKHTSSPTSPHPTSPRKPINRPSPPQLSIILFLGLLIPLVLYLLTYPICANDTLAGNLQALSNLTHVPSLCRLRPPPLLTDTKHPLL
jgi:hypothetical protein